MKCFINNIFDFKRDNINISELCRQTGITRAYWYKIINSESEPTVTLAIRITEYLNECLSKKGFMDDMYSVYDLWKEDY